MSCQSAPILAAALVAAVLILPSAPAAAQAAGQWKGPEHIYEKICSYCHDQGVGPAIKGRRLPDVYISTATRNGRLAMPAFRPTDINDAELAELAQFISKSSK